VYLDEDARREAGKDLAERPDVAEPPAPRAHTGLVPVASSRNTSSGSTGTRRPGSRWSSTRRGARGASVTRLLQHERSPLGNEPSLGRVGPSAWGTSRSGTARGIGATHTEVQGGQGGAARGGSRVRRTGAAEREIGAIHREAHGEARNGAASDGSQSRVGASIRPPDGQPRRWSRSRKEIRALPSQFPRNCVRTGERGRTFQKG
jgi:hypothetical protein